MSAMWSRLKSSSAGRRAATLFESRAFRVTSSVATVGLLGWEVVGHFARKHEELERDPGLADLVLGLSAETRRARREKEARFRELIEEARGRQVAGEDPSKAALAAHRLLYPTLTAEELRHRRETYGAVKWTEDVLAAVKARSPLLEIGAGRGQWQRALAEKGADVLALDNMSSPATRQGMRGQVLCGTEVDASKHRDRALLLVYPNPGPMAFKCLENYRGDTLVFIGEPRGGVNGDGQFFDALGRDWVLEETLPVDALADCHERLWILHRRQRLPEQSGNGKQT